MVEILLRSALTARLAVKVRILIYSDKVFPLKAYPGKAVSLILLYIYIIFNSGYLMNSPNEPDNTVPKYKK